MFVLISFVGFLFPFVCFLLGSWGFTLWVNWLLRPTLGGKEVESWSKFVFVPLALATWIGGVLVSGVLIVLSPYSWGAYGWLPMDVVPWLDYILGWFVMFTVIHLIWALWRMQYVPRHELPGFWIAAMLIIIMVLVTGALLLVLTWYILPAAVFLLLGTITIIPTVGIQFRRTQLKREEFGV